MSSERLSPDVTGWEHYDLQDLNDGRLTEAGELALIASLPISVVVKLGNNVLSLSSVSLDTESRSFFDTRRLYIVRNLTAGSSDAVTAFDNGKYDGGKISTDNETYTVRHSRSATIGRAYEATPELQLDKTADFHHAELREGLHNLHIMDLYSEHGTSVFLDPTAKNVVPHPTRRFRYDKETGDITYLTAEAGKWDRWQTGDGIE